MSIKVSKFSLQIKLTKSNIIKNKILKTILVLKTCMLSDKNSVCNILWQYSY